MISYNLQCDDSLNSFPPTTAFTLTNCAQKIQAYGPYTFFLQYLFCYNQVMSFCDVVKKIELLSTLAKRYKVLTE